MLLVRFDKNSLQQSEVHRQGEEKSGVKIVIGKAGAKNVSIDLDVLLRTRLLVQANSGGGKSWLLRLIAEQMFGKIPVHIIDPEGEFATLREKFPFVLIGEGGEAAADVRSAGLVAERLLELRASAVIDLYEAFRSKPLERRQWVRKYLEALVDAPKKLWKPLIVIVDEAQKFCPQESPKSSNREEREIINGCKDAMIALSTVGRKRRFCAVWATQRLAKIDKDASAELLNRLIGLTFEDVDIDRAVDMLSVSKEERREFKAQIRVQEPGNWYAIGRAISKMRLRFKAGDVATSHPDIDTTDYAAGPPPTPDKVKALLPKLSDLPKEAENKARTEKEYKARIRELETQVKSAQRALPAAPAKVTTKEVRVADPRAINAAVRMVKEATDKQIAERDRAVTHLVKGVKAAMDALRVAGERATQLKLPPFELPKISAGEISRKEAPGASSPTFATQRRAATSTPRPKVHSENNGNEQLTPYQLDILKGLAELESIGRKDVPMALAGVAAGKSSTSSTFERYRGKLMAAGLVKYPKPGRVALTDAGRKIAPAPDESLTAEEIQERCLKLLTPYQADLVKALVAAHPEELSREELGQRSGKQATSSTFERYLGSLKSMEIVEYTGPKMVKAADWLVEI